MVRWGSATCTILTAVAWMIIVAFCCDWIFRLPRESRGVMLVAGIVGFCLALRRWVWPFINIRESVEEVALFVEREHAIQNDLIAALQFENPESATWGSPGLSQALVENVAASSSSLDLFRGFSFEPLPKQALLLAITLMIVGSSVIVWPAHAAVFWNRLQLGSARYPTATSIESITINGQNVATRPDSARQRIRVPYGHSVAIEVKCVGTLPSSGSARLSSLGSGSTNQLPLQCLNAKQRTYTGELRCISEAFQVTFNLGDCQSSPVEIEVIPLPMVEIDWQISPPRYAAAIKPNDSHGNPLALTVLEGSAARLELLSLNKPLKTAQLKAGKVSFDLLPAEPNQLDLERWSLPTGTPFESIHELLAYEIQVVDQDGLSLKKPIQGYLRPHSDRPPTIVASAMTRYVLPTARPKLEFTATDDYGVSKVVATFQVVRDNERVSSHEILAYVCSDNEQPPRTIHHQLVIPLTQYELRKADEIKVMLSVTDWRGDIAGLQTLSEPITLNVTDIQGILTHLSEDDKKSAKQLDEILRRELAIGSDE